MNKHPVIISGYPKSGTTWATRLFADILNSPSGGSHPNEDNKEIAAEGQDRTGKYIVRKGHYRIDKTPHYQDAKGRIQNVRFSAIPSPHVLMPDFITTEHLIFMIRDPRDIIVSACHHWASKPREQIIDGVCKDGLAKLPAWDKYLLQWLDVDNVKWISYKTLHSNPVMIVQYALNGLDYDEARMIPAIKRQSFSKRKKQIKESGDDLYLGKKYNLRFMRKGIVGDYKDFLTEEEQDYVWDCLGEMMLRMGYLK